MTPLTRLTFSLLISWMTLIVGITGVGIGVLEVREPHAGSALAFGLIGASVLMFLWGLADLNDKLDRRRASRTPGDVPALSPTRRARLMNARLYLPAVLPAGWSEPMSPKGTVAWIVDVGDIALTAWTVPGDAGPTLHVALAHKASEARVTDAEAMEIFRHFRDLTEFVEVDGIPKRIEQDYPAARTWMAMPREVVAATPRPKRMPVVKDEPLNAHLVTARKHLPEKLPVGWSVPVAITEKRDGWDDGAWMIEDDDATVLVCLVTSKGRVKLAVTIFHPDQTALSEGRAMEVLKHFRSVTEFVENGDSGIQGGRLYLGEIQRKDTRALLN